MGITSNSHQSPSVPNLFVWRSHTFIDGEKFDFTISNCEWCTKQLNVRQINFIGFSGVDLDCSFCGWHCSTAGWLNPDSDDPFQIISQADSLILQSFPLSSQDIALNELGTHLQRRYDDIYSIPPRRFEELVADIFKNLGYGVRLTQSTRDGGADVLLFENPNALQAIVEVKRYDKDRTVGIKFVDRLMGAMIRWQSKKAYLITTSHFSRPSTDAVSQIGQLDSSFEIELWDATRLLKELGCYNAKLPPLELIDPNKGLIEQVINER
jgi:HJR/Mrr/RecB family endonuclease